MNSDTPRTDAQQDSCNIPLDSSACVSASFARELERENAALNAERDLYFNTLAGAMFSGKLDDLTCGELKTAYDKHKAELAALRAALERLLWQVDNPEMDIDATSVAYSEMTLEAAISQARAALGNESICTFPHCGSPGEYCRRECAALNKSP